MAAEKPAPSEQRDTADLDLHVSQSEDSGASATSSSKTTTAKIASVRNWRLR